jgi:hypothetical protein
MGEFVGELSGIAFSKNDGSKQIRAISLSEYVAAFGYHDNFNVAITEKHNMLNSLRQSIPARTMLAIIKVISPHLHSIRDAKV